MIAIPSGLRERRTALSPPRSVLVHQLILKGVADEFGGGVQAHFLEQPRPVGAHRLETDGEFVTDFLGRFPRRNHPQDLKFTIRQPFVRRFLRAGRKLGGQFLRRRRADVFAAGQNSFLVFLLSHQKWYSADQCDADPYVVNAHSVSP